MNYETPKTTKNLTVSLGEKSYSSGTKQCFYFLFHFSRIISREKNLNIVNNNRYKERCNNECNK